MINLATPQGLLRPSWSTEGLRLFIREVNAPPDGRPRLGYAMAAARNRVSVSASNQRSTKLIHKASSGVNAHGSADAHEPGVNEWRLAVPWLSKITCRSTEAGMAASDGVK